MALHGLSVDKERKIVRQEQIIGTVLDGEGSNMFNKDRWGSCLDSSHIVELCFKVPPSHFSLKGFGQFRNAGQI